MGFANNLQECGEKVVDDRVFIDLECWTCENCFLFERFISLLEVHNLIKECFVDLEKKSLPHSFALFCVLISFLDYNFKSKLNQ